MDTTFTPRTLDNTLIARPEQALEQMWLIRLFEDAAMDCYSDGLIGGSIHTCQGQEAVSVGFAAAMEPADTMTCTYRGHGHILARGSSPDACFAELLGRRSGLCRGKGGSMHLTDIGRGSLGSNAIVGGHLPITVGAAFAARYQRTSACSVAFFGDGATNIGTFHEALNFAAVQQLPAVFVIENNHYAEYSPLAATTAVSRLADRAAAYGIPGIEVDGNDVTAVFDTARFALDRARAGDGPTLVEAVTYRHHGHSRSDPANYRPEGEKERWLERDPITLLEQAMLREGFGRDQLDRARASAAAQVDRARRVALADPEPDVRTLTEDVLA